ADFCASMGLTNATVRPILGSHVSANVYPNAGQDLGDCLIYDAKSRNVGASGATALPTTASMPAG
ncbi:MAG TPA: hypothetical protein VII98_08660, partial [Solirubrobacteraceae bacterium]